MTTYIAVNSHRIRSNIKADVKLPPIRVTKGKHGEPQYGFRITIEGPSELIYDGDKPILPCGARLALVTDSEVVIHAH